MTTLHYFHDMTTLRYLVIKGSCDLEDYEVWVDVGYWTIFFVICGWWGIVLSRYGLFCVSEGEWGIILGGWESIFGGCGWVGYVGHYFEKVGVSGWENVLGG